MKQRAYCVFCHNEIMYDFDIKGAQGECREANKKYPELTAMGGHYAHEPLAAQMGRELVKSFASNPKRSRKVFRKR